ncbi:hypothetical protein D3C73_1037510 [compost metagenome]
MFTFLALAGSSFPSPANAPKASPKDGSFGAAFSAVSDVVSLPLPLPLLPSLLAPACASICSTVCSFLLPFALGSAASSFFASAAPDFASTLGGLSMLSSTPGEAFWAAGFSFAVPFGFTCAVGFDSGIRPDGLVAVLLCSLPWTCSCFCSFKSLAV